MTEVTLTAAGVVDLVVALAMWLDAPETGGVVFMVGVVAGVLVIRRLAR